MINSAIRRFVQNFRPRKSIYLCIYRKETTSLIKTGNDMQEHLEKKMKDYMIKCEDFFGITKLTEMYDRVSEIQTDLQAVQEKRRKVQEEIFVVQKKLQETQETLHRTSMGDDMYLSVVTQVRELLKEQKRLQDIFSLYDRTEREQQTTLTTAINNNKDHEKTYREKNKQLALITGIIGGILGVTGSTINNWRLRKDIKYFASDISVQVDELKKSATLNDGNGSDQLVKIDSLLLSINSLHNKLDDSIKSLQSLINKNHVNKNIDNPNYDNHIEEIPSDSEPKLNKHAYVNLGLITSCTLLYSLFIFYITRSN